LSTLPSITRSPFGQLPDGRSVERFTLANSKGVECDIITYGGTVTALRVPFRVGKTVDVVLGFDRLEDYLGPHPYFGTLVGRVAGRISSGRFTIDGKEYPLALNEAPNHLHGGSQGFDKRLWNAEQLAPSADEAALRLTYLSPDGEEGYPGNLRVEVTYAVTVRTELVIRYGAETDRATPLSLTNHSYFNLTGEGSGDILSQTLQVFSDEIAATDDAMTLLGTKSAVAGQGNDLNTTRLLGEAIPRLLNHHGDNHFIRRSSPGELVPAAILTDPVSGLTMTALTTQDCVQVFSATVLDGTLTGKSGRPYKKHAGLCLECQGCPGAVHTPVLGDIILRPGKRYDHTTIYRFVVMA
jgi:aldose 1-epimerase